MSFQSMKQRTGEELANWHQALRETAYHRLLFEGGFIEAIGGERVTVRCRTCSREVVAKVREVMREGWPKCCDATMTIDPTRRARVINGYSNSRLILKEDDGG